MCDCMEDSIIGLPSVHLPLIVIKKIMTVKIEFILFGVLRPTRELFTHYFIRSSHNPFCLYPEKPSKVSSMYFRFFPPSKRAWSVIWQILTPLRPRVLCAKFGWNWHCSSGVGFKSLWMYFCYYLSIEVTLHMKKLESSLPKAASYQAYQVSFIFTQWFWRRRRKYHKFT